MDRTFRTRNLKPTGPPGEEPAAGSLRADGHTRRHVRNASSCEKVPHAGAGDPARRSDAHRAADRRGAAAVGDASTGRNRPTGSSSSSPPGGNRGDHCRGRTAGMAGRAAPQAGADAGRGQGPGVPAGVRTGCGSRYRGLRRERDRRQDAAAAGEPANGHRPVAGGAEPGYRDAGGCQRRTGGAPGPEHAGAGRRSGPLQPGRHHRPLRRRDGDAEERTSERIRRAKWERRMCRTACSTAACAATRARRCCALWPCFSPPARTGKATSHQVEPRQHDVADPRLGPRGADDAVHDHRPVGDLHRHRAGSTRVSPFATRAVPCRFKTPTPLRRSPRRSGVTTSLSTMVT